MLQDIINELNIIDKRDIMTEAINEKLNASLKLYISDLSISCEELMNKDCMSVIKKVITKYENYDDDYREVLEGSNKYDY